MKVFQASKLTVKIANRKLCDNLTFSLQPGERLAILGPNGAGKTSLLSALTGALRPETGKVAYNGLPVHLQDRRISVGNQFTGFPLYYRVGELLHIFELSHPQRRQQRMEDLRHYLRPCLRSYFHSLSGGEQKLVANYIAISLNSECLVLDEPTSSLDVAATALIGELLAGDGRTLIFSSHDLREAMKLTKRTLFLTGKQAYHFDLRSGEEFHLYRRQGQLPHPETAPYQCCRIGNADYLFAPKGTPAPPPSWQEKGVFSPSLLLYQIFNLLRTEEERAL